MREFGSDFHDLRNLDLNKCNCQIKYRNQELFSDGRQGIIAIINQEKWNTLWVPEYFCYEVLTSIREKTNVELKTYPDNPLNSKDQELLLNLPYGENDAVLRVNYFGTRLFRSNMEIPVPVIEDHSHDITGYWANNSNADWCVASLRKSLPIASGGIVWSPKGKKIIESIPDSPDCANMMRQRWMAMEMKSNYLNGWNVTKEIFRNIFIETEEWFEKANICRIDERSQKTINNMDLSLWFYLKQKNWNLLCRLLDGKIEILKPEDDGCNLFSFVFLAKNAERREKIRKQLINSMVYPAVLWKLPNKTSMGNKDFSDRMLSIHCDGRYTEDDIRQLAFILIEAIK